MRGASAGEPTLARGDGVERIYEFRCRCGRTGKRRSRTRLVKVNCRDCGASVEWWRSSPVTPFVAPEISVELTAAQIEDIRADRWRDNTARAVALENGDLEAPHAADALAPEARAAAQMKPPAPDGAGTQPKPPACPLCKNTNTRILKSGSRQCLDCEAIWDPPGFRAPADEAESDRPHEQLDLSGLPPKRKEGI